MERIVKDGQTVTFMDLKRDDVFSIWEIDEEYPEEPELIGNWQVWKPVTEHDNKMIVLPLWGGMQRNDKLVLIGWTIKDNEIVGYWQEKHLKMRDWDVHIS